MLEKEGQHITNPESRIYVVTWNVFCGNPRNEKSIYSRTDATIGLEENLDHKKFCDKIQDSRVT